MLSRLALNLLTMVAHAGLKLILLPQPPECWDYKHESSHLFQSLVNHLVTCRSDHQLHGIEQLFMGIF
jgi:hypothetical protein